MILVTYTKSHIWREDGTTIGSPHRATFGPYQDIKAAEAELAKVAEQIKGHDDSVYIESGYVQSDILAASGKTMTRRVWTLEHIANYGASQSIEWEMGTPPEPKKEKPTAWTVEADIRGWTLMVEAYLEDGATMAHCEVQSPKGEKDSGGQYGIDTGEMLNGLELPYEGQIHRKLQSIYHQAVEELEAQQ